MVTVWQPAGGYLVGLILVISLFIFRLGSLTPMLPAENAAHQSASSIQNILTNPVNAPYKLMRLGVQSVNSGAIAERAVSVVVAASSVFLFYRLVRRFTSKHAAILGTMLYASSSALLLNGRLAAPNIMQVALLALLACGAALRFSKHRIRYWFIGTVLGALALYTPGMLYFIIAGIILTVRHVKKEKLLPKPLILGACGLVALVLLTPLIAGFISHPSIWREYFGIPEALPKVLEFLKNLAAVPLGLFVKAPFNPAYRVGKLPLLDIFAGVMFILGCIVVVKQFRLERLYLLGGIFGIGTLFTAISGNYENSLVLVPFVYLLVTKGINYLLESWKAVFPLNPLARVLSVSVLTLAVIVSTNFQARRYFVAWPNNPATKTASVQK